MLGLYRPCTRWMNSDPNCTRALRWMSSIFRSLAPLSLCQLRWLLSSVLVQNHIADRTRRRFSNVITYKGLEQRVLAIDFIGGCTPLSGASSSRQLFICLVSIRTGLLTGDGPARRREARWQTLLLIEWRKQDKITIMGETSL